MGQVAGRVRRLVRDGGVEDAVLRRKLLLDLRGEPF